LAAQHGFDGLSVVLKLTELNFMDKTLFINRICISAALATSLLSHAALAQTPPVQTPVALPSTRSPLTRAEVQADLLVWRAAGMDEFNIDDSNPYSPEYQRAVAEYVAVRRSPQFVQIEHAIERGQQPEVKLVEGPLRLSIAMK
jgi:hypothetical protein